MTTHCSTIPCERLIIQPQIYLRDSRILFSTTLCIYIASSTRRSRHDVIDRFWGRARAWISRGGGRLRRGEREREREINAFNLINESGGGVARSMRLLIIGVVEDAHESNRASCCSMQERWLEVNVLGILCEKAYGGMGWKNWILRLIYIFA